MRPRKQQIGRGERVANKSLVGQMMAICPPGEGAFATNLPQAETGQVRDWRNSAGYREPIFCGKNGHERPFLDAIICQLIDIVVVTAERFELSTY
ncbi:MAG: hypothetical protein KZQ94_01035 [Candidatus Thiodiazotropha sp. (ex Troendleina suluensis)]|nr:hypothetical protein [Candidatus Thiodiazotropha sp. (ex Troendleina suluensis)]